MAMITLEGSHYICSSSISGGVLLPEELVIEILLRLQVKSLLRFASVCRLWHTIIRSQRFIRDQVHRQESNPTTSFLLYWHKPGYFVLGAVPFCSLFSDAKLEILEEVDSGMLPGSISDMRGPCSGILCLLRWDKTFIFWNPATRGLRTVPLCPHKETGFKMDFYFGINPLTGDLKIVLINRYCYDNQFASVYNSRDNSWSLCEDRTLCDPPRSFNSFNILFEYSQPFSNGFCYWIKSDWKTGRSAIFAFDVRNDSFQDIEIPADILKPYSYYKLKLDLYNDALALIIYSTITDGRVEIWFMKERGCWEKLSSVCLSFKIYEPIGILNRNEIFVSDASKNVYIHGTDSHRTRKLEYNRAGGVSNVFPVSEFFACPYKETLASV